MADNSIKKIIFLFCFLTLISCTSTLLNYALKNAGVFDNKPTLNLLSTTDKNVIFIGMHHLGRKEFYDDVSSKVDSLQNIGYVVYYESIQKSAGIDSIAMDIYKKKFRKITGINTSQYYDTINNLFAGKYKYKGNYQLKNQPSYKKLNVDMEVAKNVDVQLKDLIDRYELEHNMIVLNDCDMATDIGSKIFDCEISDAEILKRFRSEFIFGYRDRHLAAEISNSLHGKIVVIYGKGHFEGMIRELKLLDENWQQEYID